MKNLGIAKLKANRFVEFQEGENFDIIDQGENWIEIKPSIFFNKKMVEIKLNKSDYEQSNRYKLSQFIKAQPYKAIELSVAIGHQATYLSSTASKSRFESRGDISDTKLREIMTDVTIEVSKLNTPNQETIDAMNDLNTEDVDLLFPKTKVDEVDMIRNKVREAFKSANKKPFNLDSYTPIQSRESKSIQVSKKAAWFTVFLITVLIVSLLATLIYLA